jgi:hypothetical protein
MAGNDMPIGPAAIAFFFGDAKISSEESAG